ncbi:alpha-acetolactate decarboxylase [Paraphoma chrysanthemicola]|uniref:Alpha-acetolactate decarboxylase n=1 Tax=Paraphoma chrysanthemicola TaxID=798071 RepID=A0A8K0QSC1_9PLEO|nr:alpha-acetolactate decarboxylase [Paraphoma chrysanthemicola]
MVGSIPNDIFQFSTFAALTEGFNTGQPRTADLTSHGTDGIGVYEDGTFMILLDQSAYQIRKDGTVVPGPQNARLPFAMVTIYQSTARVKIPSLSFEGLDDIISSSELGPARSINTLTPFKLTAMFKSIATEQSGSQTDIMGTIFGFVVPKWMRDISGPRVHAHFLDEDDTKGGQVTDFEIAEEVTLTFAKCGRFHLGFPQGPEWEDVKLSRE